VKEEYDFKMDVFNAKFLRKSNICDFKVSMQKTLNFFITKRIETSY